MPPPPVAITLPSEDVRGNHATDQGVGMRWDADNAEAIMTLKALGQSGGWQDYGDSLLTMAL